MSQSTQSIPFEGLDRSHWIRLRTLITLRWIAICGQLVAIAVAHYGFNLELNLGLCYIAIGAAIIANLVSVFTYPENKRLSEREALLTLVFDVSQLCFLIYLTGGLNNPFALLVLAPISIAATALSLRSTLIIGGLAVVLMTILAFQFQPLRTDMGFVMRMPNIFRYGFLVAIVIGVMFLAVYARRVSDEMIAMSDALLATQMALAREQKLTDLGGVVAAAAHELGTPLATIKLVSAELMDELEDRGELLEDAKLIRDQADRCRDILRSMGRAGKDDLHMRRAPLDSVLREAAEPHQGRGKQIHFDLAPSATGESEQPTIIRKAEVIHGLRNLVQNAVDFSTANVWIRARWGTDRIRITIVDDGKGFPPQLLGRIGDPFMRAREQPSDKTDRPGYEGMGLGLFIAKTLLERTGANVTFANAGDGQVTGPFRSRQSGAVVDVSWARENLVPGDEDTGLGENQPIPVG